MVAALSSTRICPGRNRRPALPGKFAAAFHTITYYAKRSIASDFERAVDFVKHLDELTMEHPVATIHRLAMPDGLDFVTQYLRIHQYPSETDVVNEIYVPFLKTVTNITARYNASTREPLHSIVQELFDLPQFFTRIRDALQQQAVRDVDSLIIFVYTCVVSDRTIVSFRTFAHLIDDLQRFLNRSGHPCASVLEHAANGSAIKHVQCPERLHDNDQVDFRHISVVPTINEVMCKNIADVYLPLADGSDGFLVEHPVGRLIDSSFRLLRHDMVAQIQSNLSNVGGTLTYFNAKLSRKDDSYDKTTFDVEFPVPEGTSKWFDAHIREGADDSLTQSDMKWFAKGVLVCLCKQERRPTFFGEITYNSAYCLSDKSKRGGASLGADRANRFNCTITVSIANWIDEDELKDVIRLSTPFTLIQVCHAYFSYKPVLQSLQSIQLCPLLNVLVQPNTSLPPGDAIPPALATLLQNDPQFSKRFSLLDPVQKTACSMPFRDNWKVSLIQGPPGTGKTFIGTVVASGLVQFPSNKILCICFSNHQLDQFLEAIIDIGVVEVVRLGGRSNSERLARYNLNEKVAAARERLAANRKKSESFAETRRKVLGAARIIGCTATGAAIFRNILAKADCNVLIIEEAGELLEANLLASINRHTQKLIMIGDHMQLRPKVNQYELSVESGKGYDLNRSTFERLVCAGYPLVTLQCQHRMRPEISRIVRSLCYKDLTDADKVKQYGKISGLKHDLVFVDHQYPECSARTVGNRDNVNGATSRTNRGEALLTVKIALHMLKQGYSPDDIVILTPYLGQLNEIRIILETQFRIKSKLGDRDEHEYANALCAKLVSREAGEASSGSVSAFAIRVATVDNFQGEEALIIVASLVRSNPELNIGFLQQVQRVNVLLSRAKAGLVLVGNASCLKQASPLWDQVLSHVSIAFGLPGVCQRHNVNVFMKSPEDFDELSPFGGCTTICNLKLPCGHHCKKVCHDPVQIEHEICAIKHPALCPAGHRIRASSVDKRKCQVDVYAPCPACSSTIPRKCSDVARQSNCLYCRYKRLSHSLTSRIAVHFQSRINAFSEATSDVITDCERFALEESQNFVNRLHDVCKIMVPQFHLLLNGYRKQQELTDPKSLIATKCGSCHNAILHADAFSCRSQTMAFCRACVTIRVKNQLAERPDHLRCPCASQACKNVSLDDAKMVSCFDECTLEMYLEASQARFYHQLIGIAQGFFRR